MDRSQYLVQALQDIAAQPQAGAQAPNLPGMQQQASQAQAWKAANPGQSYMAHNIGQMAQAIQQAPGAIAAVPGNIAGLFKLGGG